MARYWQWVAVAWILVAVPCIVVIGAIVMAGTPSVSVLAVGLALYLSAMLVWIVHRYCRGNQDKEQCEVTTPEEEEENSPVNTTKTPSCVLTIPTLAASMSGDEPPPYDPVQALAQAPNGGAIVHESCQQQAIGGTWPVGFPRYGTQAAFSFDESALPTYSELVASGAIPSSDGIMAEAYDKCFPAKPLPLESLRVTVDQFT